MEFRSFNFADEATAIDRLITDHWEEIAHNKDTVKLKPDWARYFALEEHDLLISTGAFEGDELVGYYVSFVAPHMHYMDDIFAVCDVIYVDPKYRKGTTGARLINAHEEACKERGVSVMTMHVKTDNDFGSLMERLEWSWAEKIYSKNIKPKTSWDAYVERAEGMLLEEEND